MQVHGLQREVGRRAGMAACLVYGALPPEARRHQAQLFNGQGNK
jgi:ATP-dependent RNA helicase SUPV3L1/SUV3